MKASRFAYHAPSTLAEALALLAEHGDSAKVLAGGQSLIPMLAMRLAVFDHLVDLGRIPELAGIDHQGDTVRIGAATTHTAVESSADLARTVPLLARAAPLIGHFQIRNRGTVGGAIAHADPAAEFPAVALALDAQLETVSPRGARTIPAEKFFLGTWSTALADDEILTVVNFPAWRGRTGHAVEELARRHGDFAIAGAVVAVELDGDDRVRRCGIGLLGLGSTPERATAAEQAVTGTAAGEIDPVEVGRAAMSTLQSVPADLHGSADYRRRVGAAMVTRAWQRALREAHDG
ncbi:xanthine dehydrogenase family protein subunit M [Parafrankia sp. FMc6]|uniref:FAD binding domain-containing protein n=1 Tax=Parafrankia soli TaxID=2599596 RepID=UPI0034D55C08